VRAHKDDGYEVFVDFSREADLEKIGTDLKLVAALHPNQGNDAFDFQRKKAAILFPVRLKDEAAQERRVERLVRHALALDARIIVLPELASTEAIEARVTALLDNVDSQHLVVVGSRHVGKDKSAQNLAFALTPECDEPIVHAKVVPFSNELRLELPWKEGINVPARPVLTIYPADRFRFCILICKDFLDKSVVAAVARLGVNVLCVPAMSEKTVSYPLRVGQVVADAQAIVVVANNPLEWDSALVDPIAVFGQPVAGREVVRSPAGQPVTAPAVSLFRLGDNAATVEAV
jgi:predicted amidohydrolase